MDKKICVLLSGGLDSFVAYRLAQVRHSNDVAGLFLLYGQPYLQKELKAMKALGLLGAPYVQVAKVEWCTHSLAGIPTPEKQEIPARNLLMALYGSLLGEEIWLSALENELTGSVPDKHPEFFLMTSDLLTYILKSLRPQTKVTTPFSILTKSEVLALGLQIGCTIDEIKTTVSCYDGDSLRGCGKCLACFKRWVALVNNDISWQDQFQAYPASADNDYYLKVVPEMEAQVLTGKGRFSKKRIVETHMALRTQHPGHKLITDDALEFQTWPRLLTLSELSVYAQTLVTF